MNAMQKIVLTITATIIITADAHAGRWLSRDPIQDGQGFVQRDPMPQLNFDATQGNELNLYGFVMNDGVNAVDPYGLWHWKNGKRGGGPRATVIPDKNGDSYSDLAALVRLDPTEVNKWLKTWKPNSQVTPCDEFTVPNTVYIDLLKPMSFHLEWFWWPYSRGEINKFTSQGYFVLYNENVDSLTVLNQFRDPNIFCFENIADGDLNQLGTLQTTDYYGLKPNIKGQLHYKLGGFKLIQCYGGVLPWYQLVSPNGYYWATVGYLHIYNAPAHGF